MSILALDQACYYFEICKDKPINLSGWSSAPEIISLLSAAWALPDLTLGVLCCANRLRNVQIWNLIKSFCPWGALTQGNCCPHSSLMLHCETIFWNVLFLVFNGIIWSNWLCKGRLYDLSLGWRAARRHLQIKLICFWHYLIRWEEVPLHLIQKNQIWTHLSNLMHHFSSF